MKRDFIAELKARLKAIDNPDKPIVINSGRRKEDKEVLTVPLYNVHKISLPAGINKVVLVGVTLAEAEWWIENKLKARAYHNNDDEKTLIFYEKFRQDAKPHEKSIYHNPERFCTEDFPTFGNPRRIN